VQINSCIHLNLCRTHSFCYNRWVNGHSHCCIWKRKIMLMEHCLLCTHIWRFAKLWTYCFISSRVNCCFISNILVHWYFLSLVSCADHTAMFTTAVFELCLVGLLHVSGTLTSVLEFGKHSDLVITIVLDWGLRVLGLVDFHIVYFEGAVVAGVVD